jgi:hypothetical protein
VAGKHQQTGEQAKATVLYRRFSDDEDVLTLDLRSVYDVPSLTKLERTMIYSRKGTGKASFEDNFAFSRPESFETAVVTRAGCKKISDDRILLEGKTQKMEVLMMSPGNKLSIREEKISEGGTPYTRIGVYIDKPVKEGKIILTYIPIRN